MSEAVNLPALGESVTEGTVTRWLKNVGDTVEVDEPLVEVSTDKVDTEIPSPIAGVVEQILVAEDETVEVGAPLAIIGDGSSASAAAAPAEAAPAEVEPVVEAEAPVAEPVVPAVVQVAAEPVAAEPVAAPVAATAPVAAETPVAAAPVAAPNPVAAAPVVAAVSQAVTDSGEPYLTPIVRKLANDNGVDISKLVGTGVGGRIRKEDVLGAAVPTTVPVAADSTAKVSAKPVVSELRGTTKPFSRLRKIVAERAVESMQQTAQLTTVVEIDVTEIAKLRDKVKAEFLAKTGQKLSFLPFFAKAATEALQTYPIINATVEGESIVYPAVENLSIAVDTERGLLTPVIKDAGALDIAGFATEIADLADRTRNNQLKPDELSGGTFTLTNTGSRGALFDTPVVFLPQVAILGTGVVTKRAVVINDAIAIRSMVYLALSYDHRVVDGADAARFLTTVKARLEAGNFDADLGI